MVWWAPDGVSPSQFLDLYPHLRWKKILLFLGRLHKKKGVHLLVKAWNIVSSQIPDADLVLAGPGDGDLDTIVLLGPSTRSVGYLRDQ